MGHLGRGQAESIQGRFEDPRIGLSDPEFVRVDARLEVSAESGGVLHLRQVPTPTPTRVRDQSDSESMLRQRTQGFLDVGKGRGRPRDDGAVDCLVDRRDHARIVLVQPRESHEGPDLFVRRKLAVFGPHTFEPFALAVVRPGEDGRGRSKTLFPEQDLQPPDPERPHRP